MLKTNSGCQETYPLGQGNNAGCCDGNDSMLSCYSLKILSNVGGGHPATVE